MKFFKAPTAKHAKSQNAAVAYLKRMPMWQRIVSAIMAVLLVFLLWPADAAKTITAWANDTEAPAPTEEQVIDPEPEYPDPGTGGEEADEPTSDPEDEAEEPKEIAGPVLLSDDELLEEDVDENIHSLNEESDEECGPFEWDFSAYFGSKTTLSTSSTPKTEEYYATNKAALITFIGPYSANYSTLDGGSTTIDSNGYTMNKQHMLKSDGGSKNTHGTIFNNYIKIIPQQNLRSISLNVASVYTSNSQRYAVVGIVKKAATGDTYSKNYIQEFTLNSTNYKTVTFTNGEGFFEQDAEYYIYSRPNNCGKNDYYKYGGIKINNIKTEGYTGKFKLNLNNICSDDIINIAYQDSSGRIFTQKDISVSAGDDHKGNFEFESESVSSGNLKGLEINSEKTGKSIVFGQSEHILPEIPDDGSTIDLDDLSYYELCYKISGYITKGAGTDNDRIGVTVKWQDYYETEEYIIEPAGKQTEFYIPCFASDGIIKLTAKNLDDSSIKYNDPEIYIKYNGENIDNASINIERQGAPKEEVSLTINPSSSFTTLEDNVKVYKGIPLLFGLVYYVEVQRESDGKYHFFAGDNVKLETMQGVIWFHTQEEPTVSYEREFLINEDLTLIAEVPVYSWDRDDLENVKCTGYCDVIAAGIVVRVTETCTMEDHSVTENVIKRPTSKDSGLTEYTASFTKKNVFSDQTYELTTEKEISHIHDGKEYTKLTFNTTTHQLPTDGYWYLDSDIGINKTATINVGDSLHLDLNGYALYWEGNEAENEAAPTHLFIQNKGSLEIFDCKFGKEYCRHYFNPNSDGKWVLDTSGNTTDYYVDGGVITGANYSAIYNEGTLDAKAVNFVGNENKYRGDSSWTHEWTYPAGTGGGAIRSGSLYRNPKCDLLKVNFIGNVSMGGGGAVLIGMMNTECYAGTANISYCEFENNKQIGESTSTSGYYSPWGGGALATFSKNKSPIVKINSSNFYDNTSNYRAGAIFLFHGTTCYMDSCTIQNNTSGLKHDTITDKSVCYNYGGGINVYTGYGSTNYNSCDLYLSGKMNVTNNMSREYNELHEDNLALQLQDNTKGYVHIDPNNPLNTASLIGVNYAKNTDLDISDGYGASMLDLKPGSQDLNNPSVQCFVLDEVVGRLSYELLVNTKINNSIGSYELWIVPHEHNFTYSTYADMPELDDPAIDTISLKCDVGFVQRNYNDGTYTFSKCKYGNDELPATICSVNREGEWWTDPIIYDGKEHPVEIRNYYEFLNHTFAVPATDIMYYKRSTGSHEQSQSNKQEQWEPIDFVPVDPGWYKAKIAFYDVQVVNGEIVVDKSKAPYEIESNEYCIKGSEVTVEIATIEKHYDGTTEAVAQEAHIIDGLVGEDANYVSVKMEEDAIVYCDSKFVGVNNIVSYKASDFSLEGDLLHKYSIGQVVGFVSILPLQQSVEPTSFKVKPEESISLLESLTGDETTPPACIAPDPIITYSDSTDPIYKYSDVGEISGNTFTAKAQADIESRRVELEELEETPETVYGVKINIYIAKLEAVNVGPTDEDSPEYLGVEYPVPPVHGEYKVITGYIIFQIPEAVIEFQSKEYGRWENDAGEEVGNLNLKILTSKGTYERQHVDPNNPEESYISFTDDFGKSWINVHFVVTDPGFQFLYMIDHNGNEIRPDSSDIIFQTAGLYTYNVLIWQIPVMNFDLTVTSDVPEGHKVSLGENIHFTVQMTNLSSVPIRANSNDSGGKLKFTYYSAWGVNDKVEMDVGYLGTETAENTTNKTFEYTVTSEDIAFGRLGLSFTSEAWYNNTPDPEIPHWDGRCYSNNPTIEIPTEDIRKDIVVEITAEPIAPAKIPVHINDEIKYFAVIKNYSNINVYDTVISSDLLGLTGNKAIPYQGEEGKGKLMVNEVSDPIELGTYKVLGENVEAGFVINNVQANGTIQKSSTVKEGIYGKATSNIKVDYAPVPYPTAISGLLYDGTAQQGVDFDSGCMTIDDNFKAIDAGIYYSTVTLKPWYRWDNEDDKGTTYTVRYEIEKAFITAKQFTYSDDYDGKVKNYDIKSCFNYKDAGWIGDEGLATASATTLGADAKTYYHNPDEGESTIQVSIAPKDGTNLNNYIINYAENSTIVINPYELDSSEIEVSATDLVYNAQIQTTRVSVVDTRFGENGKTLVKDRDYVIVENSDTGKDAQDYTLQVTGIEGSNYSTSKTAQYGWKITPASLSLKVVGHSASYKYNGTKRSIEGYDLVAVSNPQGLPTEGKVKPTPAEITASRTDIGTSESLPESEQAKFNYEDGETNVHVTWEFEGGILNITPVDITKDGTLTVESAGDLTYNGDIQTKGFVVKYKPDDAGVLTLDNEDYTITGNTGKDASDKYSASITGIGNYSGTKTNISWEIAKYPLTISHEPYIETYSGEVFVKEIVEQPFGADKDTVTVRLTTTSSNWGTYSIDNNKLIYETIPTEGTLLSNFAITQSNIQIVINKRALIVLPVGAEFDYDGEEHKLTEYTYEKSQLCPGHIIDPDNNAITWENNSATEANEPGQKVSITKVVVTNANAQTEVTRDVSENYLINKEADPEVDPTATLLIKKAKMYIDVTGNTLGADELNPLYYTGKTQTVSEYKVSVDYAKTSGSLKEEFDASKISPSPQKCIAQGSSVGTHDMMIIKEDGTQVAFDDSANWSYDDPNIDVIWNLAPGYVVIQAKVLTINVNDSKYYDPEEATHEKFIHWVNVDKTSPSYEVDGLAEGEELNSIKLETVSGEKGKYDELNKEFTSVIDWGNVNRENYILEYYVVLTIDELQIITVTGHRTNDSFKRYYTGYEQSETGYEVSSSKPDFFKPENFHVKPECAYKLTVTGTNAGTYWMGLKPSDFYYDYGTDPYEIKVEDGRLEIQPKELEDSMLIKAEPDELEYNGQNQGPTFIIRNGDEATGTYLTDRDYKITGGSGVEVNTYTAIIEGQGNYSGQIRPVYWKIVPAKVTFTIVGNSDERTYNGEEQTVSGYNCTVNKLRPYIDMNKLTVDSGKDTVTASYAGKYPMRLDSSVFHYVDKNITPIFDVTNGFIKINPKDLSELQITLTPNEFTYNGSSQSPTLKIVDGAKTLDNDSFVVSGTSFATAAGNYSLSVTPSNTEGNYTGTVTLPWVINKAFIEVDITGNSASFDYDGTEKYVAGYTSVLHDETPLEVYSEGLVKLNNPSKAYVAGTNANKYYMGLQVGDFYYDDESVNVKFNVVADGCLEIKPISIKNANITVNPTEFKYTGSVQGPNVVVKYNGIDLAENTDYYLYGSKATNAGDYTLTVSGSRNFTESRDFSWSIAKAKLHADIKGKHASYSYNGVQQSVSGWNATYTPSETPYSFTVYPTSDSVAAYGTEVGTYPMKLDHMNFSISDPDNIDFTYDVDDGYLQITGIDLGDCTVTAENRTYNGREQYTKIIVKDASGYVYTEGEDYEVVSGNSATDVENTITATIKGLGKCSGQTIATWSMLTASITATVVCDNVKVTYDAQEHSVGGYSVYSDSLLFNQGKVSYSQAISPAKQTNAGFKVFTLDAGGFSYNDANITCMFNVESGGITVDKAYALISSKAVHKFDSNRFTIDLDSGQIVTTGICEGDLTALTLSTNQAADGTYRLNDEVTSGVTASPVWKTIENADASMNYDLHYDVELTIKSSEKTIIYVYGKTGSYTYDGTQKTVSGFTYSASDPAAEYEITTTKSTEIKQTNAGTYYMGLSASDFTVTGLEPESYEVEYVDGYLQINPKDITYTSISVSPTQFTYNGNSQGPGVTVIDDKTYLTPKDYDVVNGSAIDAGKYVLTVTGKGNYTGTSSSYAWEIAKADLTITVNRSMEFSGKIFNYVVDESEIEGAQDRDGIEVTLSTSDSKVGVYKFGDQYNRAYCDVTGTGANNYNIIPKIVLSIEKRHLTVTPASKEFTYSGVEQKLSNDEVEFDNLADNHSITINEWVNNGFTNVGKQDNVAVSKVTILDAAQKPVTDNYLIDFATASITINKATIKIHVEGDKQTFAYDGLPHTASGFTSWELPADEGGQILGIYNDKKLVAKSDIKVSAVDPKYGTTDTKYYMNKTFEDFVYNDTNVNYEIDYSDGWVDIKKNTFDAAVVTTKDYVYDGSRKFAQVTVSINGIVLSNKDYRISEFGSTTQAVDAGIYKLNIMGLGKYQGATTSATWQITKANMTIAVNGKNTVKEYNAQEQVFPETVSVDTLFSAIETSATGLFNPSNISLAEGYAPQAKGTELGKYTVGLDVSQFEYNDDNINAQFVLNTDAYMQIDRADISKFTATATDTVYNAAEQTTSISVNDGTKDLVFGTDFVLEGQLSGTNVGEYLAKATGIGNYKGSIINIPWHITKADLTIQIIANEKTVEYNGYSQSVSGYSATAIGGATNLFVASDILLVEGKQAIKTETDVGDYTLSLDSSFFVYDNPNINATFVGTNDESNGAIAVNKLHITKKQLVIHAVDVKCEDSAVLEHRISTSDVDGTVAGQVLSGTVSTLASGAGEYTGNMLKLANLKIDGKPLENANAVDPTDNYEIVNESKLIITGPEASTINVTGVTKTVEYNGQAQSIAADDDSAYIITTNMPDFDMSKLHINGTFNLSGQNVSEKTSSVTATYDGDAEVNVTQSKLVIEKRSLTKAELSYDQQTYTYNNKDQYPAQSSFTLKDFGSPLTGSSYEYVTPVEGSSVIPGHYSLELKGTGNYKDSVFLSYEIVKASRVVQVIGQSDTVTFDGSSHSITTHEVVEQHFAEETDVIDKSAVLYTPAWPSATGKNAGTYAMNLDASKLYYNGANKAYVDVGFVVTDGVLTIDKVDISDFKVTVDETEFVYNAKAQGPKVLSVTQGGVAVPVDGYDITGNSEVNANTFAQENYVLKVAGKGNYTGESTVNWNILKAQRTVTVTGNSASVTYKGIEQSVVGWTAVEASEDKVVNPSLITPSSASCVAKGTDFGIYRMNLKQSDFAYGDPNNVAVDFQVTDGILTINKCDINDISFVGHPEQIVYNGNKQAPTIELYNAAVKLTENKDYVLNGEKSATNVKYDAEGQIDKYILTIDSTNSKNYTGTKTFEWSIIPLSADIYINGTQDSKQFSGSDITISDYTFTTSLPDATKDLITKSKILYKNSGDIITLSGKDVGTYKKGLSSTDFDYNDANIAANFIINNDLQLVITPKDINDPTIEDVPVHYTYSGYEIEAELAIFDNGNKLVQGEDFVAYNIKGTNVGEYTATIEGINNYSGQNANVKWYIDKADLQVTVDGKQIAIPYDGVRPTYSVNGYNLTCTNYPNMTGIVKSLVNRPSQFEFMISKDSEDPELLPHDADHEFPQAIEIDKFPEIHTENVNVTFNEGLPLKLTVLKQGSKDLSDFIVTYHSDYTYNGNAQGPLDEQYDFSVKDPETMTPLIPETDYDVVATSGNISETNVSSDVFCFKIVGKGAYYGEITNNFWMIQPKEITSDLTYNEPYSGSQLTHTFKLNDISQDIIEGQSFDVNTTTMNGEAKGVDAGEYKYPVTDLTGNYATCEIVPTVGHEEDSLLSNYIFTCPITLVIDKNNFSNVTVNGSNPDYNGQTQTLSGFSVTDNNGRVLVKDVDYTLSGDINKKDHKTDNYELTVTPKGPNYTGSSKTKTWNINQISFTGSVEKSKTYDGEKFNTRQVAVSTGIFNEKLIGVWETDSSDAGTYKLSESHVTQVGSWAEGEGTSLVNYNTHDINMSVTLTIDPKPIDPNSPDFTINVSDKTYDGTDQTPTVEIKDGSYILTSNDFDWAPVEADTKDVGTYHITISGKGNYSGVINNVEWKITPKPLEAYMLSESKPYSGSVISKGITLTGPNIGLVTGESVKLLGKTRTSAAGVYRYDGTDKSTLDFSIDWGLNTKPTNYTYNFTGEISIGAIDLSDFNVTYTNELSYNGRDQRPDQLSDFAVTDSKENIVDPSEYEVVGSYGKNYNEDGYSFVVKAKTGGNYTGQTEAKEWSITKRDITAPTFNESKTYDRNLSGYSVTKPLDSANGLVAGEKILLTATANDNGEPAVNVGEYTDLIYEWATGNSITSLENYNIIDPASGKMTIKQKNASFVSIEGSANYKQGNPFAKTFIVNQKTANGVLEGDEFSVEFTTYNNGSASGAAGDYAYTSEHTGNYLELTKTDGDSAQNYNMTYAGSLSITTRSIDPSQNGEIKYEVTNPVYDAKDVLPSIVIKDTGTGKTLELDTDYTVDVIAQRNVLPAYAPKYTLTITGNNEYSGSFVARWNVKPAPATIDLSDSKPYDSNPYEKSGIEITQPLKGTDKLTASVTTYKHTTKCGDVGDYKFATANADDLNTALVKLTDADEGQTIRNYTLTINGQITITPRSFDPTTVDVSYDASKDNPTYDAENHQPENVVVTDKALERVPLVLGVDFEFVSVPQTNVSEDNYVAIIKGIGNYSSEGAGMSFEWNIAPRDYELVVEAESPFNGEPFKHSGTQATGYGEDAFDFTYVTDDSKIGTYTLGDKEFGVTGEYEPAGKTLSINYNITENVTLKIVEAPVPPQPEPDVPEYVPGQTGDGTPVVGFSLIALTMIGAFLVLRRKRA